MSWDENDMIVLTKINGNLERIANSLEGQKNSHSSMPAHEEISKDVEISDPPCGNPKCLHNCNECVNYYDRHGESEPLTIIDLIEQFMEYVAVDRNWSLSNIHGHVIGRESVGVEIHEFARVAKPLNDPMGSHEDKLKDFLTYLRKPENRNHIVGTDDKVLQEYWATFQ